MGHSRDISSDRAINRTRKRIGVQLETHEGPEPQIFVFHSAATARISVVSKS
jgi:hypothetical protein